MLFQSITSNSSKGRDGLNNGIKMLSKKPQNDFSSSQISRLSNLFLIRLDMFDVFMARFEDMRYVTARTAHVSDPYRPRQYTDIQCFGVDRVLVTNF